MSDRAITLTHRPTRVQMVRWTGKNRLTVQDFASQSVRFPGSDGCEVYDRSHGTWITVLPGQWVVQGVMGEYYPLDNEARIRSYQLASGPSFRVLLLALAFFSLGLGVSEAFYHPVGSLAVVAVAIILFVGGMYGYVKDWLHEEEE